MKRAVKLILANFIPVVVFEILLFIFWSTSSGIGVIIFQLLYNTFILPALLLFLNYNDSLHTNQKRFGLNAVLILLAFLTGNALGYINWGVTTGYLTSPDPMKIMMVRLEITVGLIVLSLGGLFCYIRLSMRSNESF